MKKKSLLFILIFSMIFQIMSYTACGVGEPASNSTYNGVKNGDAYLNSVYFSDIQKHWAKQCIQEVASLHYMKGYKNKFAPDKKLTNGEAIVIAIRAMGKDKEALKLYPENWMKGYYEIASTYGLIEEIDKIDEEQLKPNPKSAATREDVAYWISKALNLKPLYGDEVNKIYNYKDFNTVSKSKLPYIEALLQKGYINGVQKQLFGAKRSITRAQVAQILYNASDDIAKNRGITTKEGQIIEKKIVVEDGKKVTYFTVQNSDGSRSYLKYDIKNKNVFIVQKNKALKNPNVLEEADYIKYFLNTNNEVMYCRFIEKKDFELTGTIEMIDTKNNTIKVLDFYDKTHVVKIQPSTIIEIQQKQVPLKDLFYGQEVTVTLKGNDAAKIVAIPEEAPDRQGYIPPNTKFRVGDVFQISKGNIEIKTNLGTEKYNINPETTRVTKNGVVANLFQIKPGDKVKITFDDIYTKKVSSIRVEDDEKHIKGILKGKLQLIDDRGKEILLTNSYIYNEGRWNSYDEKKVKLKGENASIYEGGQKIPFEQLKQKIGREVYAAFDGSYGEMRISKMLLKSGLSVSYNDKTKNVEYGTNKMVVDNNPLYFHEGTIVIRQNRLVDPLNIDSNQDVFVCADMNKGRKMANLVAINGTDVLDNRVDGTKLLVYKGKIEDIYDYEVKIGKINYKLEHMVFDDNKFSEVNGSERLTLSDDTLIYDSELQKTIPTNYFVGSRYIDLRDIKHTTLRKRLKNNFYKNKIAYFVVRKSNYGEQVLAVNLIPDVKTYKQNVKTDYATIAEIKDVDIDNETITLTKVKDFNTMNKRWTNSSDETIDVTKGVFLVNDIPLTKDEIYKLQPNNKIYIIKNKNTSLDTSYIMLIED